MRTEQSPLFVPVIWEGEGFKILDETQLPWKTDYIDVRDLPQALRAVKEMKTRAFGQVLTFFYAAALVARAAGGENVDSLRAKLRRLGEEFTEVRPTFDFKALAEYFEPWLENPPDGTGAGRWFEAKIRDLVSGIVQARGRRAKFAAELLPNPCRLLTHCNVSGEFAAVANFCREMGKEIRVIATETRPYLQGSRLSAWELAQAGVEVELIPDAAVGQVIAAGIVDAVLVGADRSARNGDIINKVGTYPIAVVAKRYGVPFYVLVQDPGRLETGGGVEIEERPSSELFQLQGRSLVESGIEGRYPAFDVTPAALISRLIGFDGTYTPEEFRWKYQPAVFAIGNEKKSRASLLLLYGVPKTSSYVSLARTLKLEKAEHILLPEMRPELWGLHIVAKKLGEQDVPLQLISDNMMGTFFAQGLVRRLYLFCEVGEKGPVGIAGSFLAVLLARAHDIPVELLPTESVTAAALDRDVSTFMGRRVSPDGVRVYPVQRETIPWSVFTEQKAGGA